MMEGWEVEERVVVEGVGCMAGVIRNILVKSDNKVKRVDIEVISQNISET